MKGLSLRKNFYKSENENPFEVTNKEFKNIMAHIKLEDNMRKQGCKPATINEYNYAISEMYEFLEVLNIDILELNEDDLSLYRQILIRRGQAESYADRKISRIKKYLEVYQDTINELPSVTGSIVNEIQNGNIYDLEMLFKVIEIQLSTIIKGCWISEVRNNKRKFQQIKSEKWGRVHVTKYHVRSFDKMCLDFRRHTRASVRLGKMVVTYDKLLNTNWKLVAEEQELKLEKLRVYKKQVKELKVELNKLTQDMIKVEDNQKRKESLESNIEVLKTLVKKNWANERGLKVSACKWIEEKKKIELSTDKLNIDIMSKGNVSI